MKFYVTYRESLKFSTVALPDVETLAPEVKWLNDWSSDQHVRIGEIAEELYVDMANKLIPYYDVYDDFVVTTC